MMLGLSIYLGCLNMIMTRYYEFHSFIYFNVESSIGLEKFKSNYVKLAKELIPSKIFRD